MRRLRNQGTRAASGGRAVIVLLTALGGLLMGVGGSRAAEIIPSFGLTRPVNGGGDAKGSWGLALRGDLMPFLQDEIAVGYRSESRFDGGLTTRMWPVTASLWLRPVPMLYGGAGVGWYNVTYDYDPSIVGPLQDETHQQFGVHVGGGVRVPVAPSAALDLHGRYVMMRDQRSRLVPERFDPDYWTASLGLAFHF